jgi:hypothetical protein
MILHDLMLQKRIVLRHDCITVDGSAFKMYITLSAGVAWQGSQAGDGVCLANFMSLSVLGSK